MSETIHLEVNINKTAAVAATAVTATVLVGATASGLFVKWLNAADSGKPMFPMFKKSKKS